MDSPGVQKSSRPSMGSEGTASRGRLGKPGKLGNERKSAECCHETLSRQMKTGDYETSDWATNAAILSQFYLAQDNYISAR